MLNKNTLLNTFLIISIVMILQHYFYNNKMDNEGIKINYILKQILENYVDSVDMSSLIESSIEQTLKNLDPHSIYMNKNEVSSSMDMMEGSFEGIGVEFSIKKDTIIVINVIPEGPSEKIGIKVALRAPSARRRLNKPGNLIAVDNASAIILFPRRCACKIVRINPKKRLPMVFMLTKR